MIRRICAHTARRSGDSRSRGFTLIEILVASLLLLFAMAGIVPFFLTGLTQASAVRYKSIATNIARQKMEQIRQLDYREITDAAFLEERFGTLETQRDLDFSITYDVANEETDYGEGRLKKVTVTISWDDTEYVSPASMTTFIHQQYLGPRISYIEINPVKTDYGDTIFPRLHDKYAGETVGTTIKIHVAEADWGLVFDDLNEPTMSARDVYSRVVLYDDAGQPLQLGDSANDYKITNLQYSASDGLVTDVYFTHAFQSTAIPDGYWNLCATVYNPYDEPGNTWRLRVRVENGPPEVPTLLAVPQPDNETVEVSWVGGGERDRAYYVLKRYRWVWDLLDPTWGTWRHETILGANLAPDSNAYTDEGYIDPELDACIDPWGTDSRPHWYKYELYAVDTMARSNEGEAATYVIVIPDSSTTTTSEWVYDTTTTSSTSTTVFVEGSADIVNETNKVWTVVITHDETGQTWTKTVGKNETLTVTGLPAGNYNFTATAAGRQDKEGSFAMPRDDGDVILQIT